MCTLSWLYSESSLHIFFNRDESKARPKALVPTIYSNSNGHDYIMPTDTQSDGSWIGVTQSGLCLCLLNFYQGKTPSGELISRGLLIKALLELSDKQSILNYLNTRNWQKYAPFTLVLFFQNSNKPTTFCWDGERLYITNITSPYTSSGVDFPEVSASRQNIYNQYFKLSKKDSETIKINKLKDFHCSHSPEKSKYSVCMHRLDANTVSFSQIKITPTKIEFEYIDGPPCQGLATHISTLKKVAIPDAIEKEITF